MEHRGQRTMTGETDGENGCAVADRCREMYGAAAVQGRGWQPNLFWRPDGPRNPFGRLRVNPWELEVLFSAILGVPAQGRDLLESRSPGRAGFIERSIAHGELPLLGYWPENR